MIVVYVRLFASLRPELVVAHEEYSAVVAAEALGIQALFLTDFFMDPISMPMQALQYAAEVIFLGGPGVFTEPPHLRNKIRYVGHVVRSKDNSTSARECVREKMKIAPDCMVVLCQPGSWGESEFPFFELITGAWETLPAPKHLIWVGGVDFTKVVSKFKGRDDITVLRHTTELNHLIVASNLLVTKSNRQTIYEAACLGVRSISISNGLNWPDDAAAYNIPSNVHLMAAEVTPEILRAAIENIIQDNLEFSRPDSNGARRAAEIVADRCGPTVFLPREADLASADD
jgi:UDP-N-acetylglucosamine:LPS N-acetylglucosamine transferase